MYEKMKRDAGLCQIEYDLFDGDSLIAENIPNGHINILSSAPDLLKACKRLVKIADVATLRQIIEHESAIEAAGLNPYCVNEGADSSDTVDLWWAYDAINKAEGKC